MNRFKIVLSLLIITFYQVIQVQSFEFILFKENEDDIFGHSFKELQELFGEGKKFSFDHFHELTVELYKLEDSFLSKHGRAQDLMKSGNFEFKQYELLLLDHYGDWLQKVAAAYGYNLIFRD